MSALSSPTNLSIDIFWELDTNVVDYFSRESLLALFRYMACLRGWDNSTTLSAYFLSRKPLAPSLPMTWLRLTERLIMMRLCILGIWCTWWMHVQDQTQLGILNNKPYREKNHHTISMCFLEWMTTVYPLKGASTYYVCSKKGVLDWYSTR